MLNHFLADSLIRGALFLGYRRNFRNVKMLFDISGVRGFVDVHNLSHTAFYLQQVSNIVTACWARFSHLWFIDSKVRSVTNARGRYSAETKHLVRYMSYHPYGWRSGLLCSDFSSLAIEGACSRFPSAVFYVAYTPNLHRFREASKMGILQFSVIDTNSGCIPNLAYKINANEKSARSHTYFLRWLSGLALRSLGHEKCRLLAAICKSDQKINGADN